MASLFFLDYNSSHMKNFSRLFILLGIFFSCLQAQAFELSLVGGVNLATPSDQVNSSSSTGTSKLAFGGGALLGFSMVPTVELEIGALYMGRHFTAAVPTGSEEDTYYSFEVPVIVRLIGLRYLTVGAGAYYAVPQGQDSYNLSPTSGSASSGSTTATSNFKNDLGAVASVGIKFPIGVASNFLIDGRYYYGLTNMSQNSNETLKARDLQILAGINFEF